MSEADILNVLRASNEQITTHYGQVISITFAMVLAIYYFLNRAPLALKALGFLIYLIGFLMFVGLMLEESNVKARALLALTNLGDHASELTRGILALQQSWLFKTTAVLLNLGLWMLPSATAFLLFVWRKPGTAQSA